MIFSDVFRDLGHPIKCVTVENQVISISIADMETPIIFWTALTFCMFSLCRALGSNSNVKICKDSPIFRYDESMHLLLNSDKPGEFARKSRSPTERTTYNRKEAKCPSGFRAIEEPAPKRTCPYYIVINYDPYRLPVVVFEARCKCRECLTAVGTAGGVCKPVYYFRQVLMKVSKNSNCYNHKIQGFSVGCHCIGSSSKETSQITSQY